MASDAFDVYLNGKLIDTVFASVGSYDYQEMKKSLVEHDGYDPSIEVKVKKQSVNARKEKKTMTKAEEKKIDKKVESLYYKRCSGIQINVMDIGAVFKVGKAAALAGKSDDAIGDEIFTFVQTIRKN